MTNILLGVLILASVIDLFYYIKTRQEMKELRSRIEDMEFPID